MTGEIRGEELVLDEGGEDGQDGGEVACDDLEHLVLGEARCGEDEAEQLQVGEGQRGVPRQHQVARQLEGGRAVAHAGDQLDQQLSGAEVVQRQRKIGQRGDPRWQDVGYPAQVDREAARLVEDWNLNFHNL